MDEMDVEHVIKITLTNEILKRISEIEILNLPVKIAWTNRLVCGILFVDKKISCTYDSKV